MQLDIGFGDVITPGPTEIEYPSMLDFPAPVLRAYPRETVIAEKLEALTALGLLKSRMKDYYDLALLSRMYPFNGELLADAIAATFRHRGTTIEATPIGLTQAYCDDPARVLQWRAFVRRSRFREETGDLTRLIDEIKPFLLPVPSKIAADNPFSARWKPGGTVGMTSYFVCQMGLGKRNRGSALSYAKRSALLSCSDASIKEVFVTGV